MKRNVLQTANITITVLLAVCCVLLPHAVTVPVSRAHRNSSAGSRWSFAERSSINSAPCGDRHTLVIGAGAAGLAAAHFLRAHNCRYVNRAVAEASMDKFIRTHRKTLPRTTKGDPFGRPNQMKTCTCLGVRHVQGLWGQESRQMYASMKQFTCALEVATRAGKRSWNSVCNVMSGSFIVHDLPLKYPIAVSVSACISCRVRSLSSPVLFAPCISIDSVSRVRCSVTVLEGRARIGGRTYSSDDSRSEDSVFEGIDRGGHWVHGGRNNPITSSYLDFFDLPRIAVGGDSTYEVRQYK